MNKLIQSLITTHTNYECSSAVTVTILKTIWQWQFYYICCLSTCVVQLRNVAWICNSNKTDFSCKAWLHSPAIECLDVSRQHLGQRSTLSACITLLCLLAWNTTRYTIHSSNYMRTHSWWETLKSQRVCILFFFSFSQTHDCFSVWSAHFNHIDNLILMSNSHIVLFRQPTNIYWQFCFCFCSFKNQHL